MLILSFCFFLGNILSAASKDPVAVLFQASGKVEYTKDGNQWRKIRHSKFLFAGYQIRTGDNGSAKITIQESGKNLQMGPSSQFEVTTNGLQATQGKLTVQESSGKLATGLMQRFTKSQTYTTVRRSVEIKNGIDLDFARNVVLSDDYPYLAWDNPGSQYSFELKIGDQVQQVPASPDPVIMTRVSPFSGTRNVEINVLENGKVVASLQPFQSKGEEKSHTLTWLEKNQKADLQEEINTIKETYGEKSFMLGSLFEKQEMWVAAMRQYQEYLAENPDEIEMTPYLFRVYKRLKLEKKYTQELINWQKAIKE